MDFKKLTLGPSKKDRRHLLCEELAGSVKRVQELYIRSKEVKCGNSSTELLCDVIEAIFLHELKNTRGQIWREVKRPNPSIPPDPSFWSFIEPMVSDDIKMQLLALRNSESDVRKCRSWVRLVLAKGLLLSFMSDLLRHPGLLACHYGGKAILRHLESTEIIVGHLSGISSLRLEYDYANPNLDSWDPTALHLACLWSPPRSIKERSVSTTSRSSAQDGAVPRPRKSTMPSSEDVEGVSIIDLALDKYSQKKARASKVSDSELIDKERSQKEAASTASSKDRTSYSETESSRSYGAMLRSYANNTNQTGMEGLPEEPRCDQPPAAAREGYSMAISMDFEIVPDEGPPLETTNTELVLKDHLTVLAGEQGMDQQNYQCTGCKRQIGLIFGQSRLCKYNGQHYCFDCHHDDERIVPARVLFNWDFRKHKVSVSSAQYLDRIQHTKMLDVSAINKALYLYIPEIEDARRLRRQCNLLKGFVLTCKDLEVGEQFKKRLRHSYIYEHIHKYTLQDLVEVHGGSFGERLRKTVRMSTKHIRQCVLCSQRGFICEVCQSNEVIYPFDIANTYQCSSCKALFHQACKPAKGNCPKCFRMRKKQVVTSDNDEPPLTP